MVTADAFKSTLRQAASGVVVITTELAGRPKAMTATAFTPLSADPPLVIVCVNQHGLTHQALCERTCFGINVLSDRQREVAERFAGRSDLRDHFDDLTHFRSPSGCLLLSDSAAVIEARRVRRVEGGDHSIFIAEVTWSRLNPGVRALVYSQGAYQRLAPLPRELVAG